MLPVGASNFAGPLDALFWGITALSVIFTLLVAIPLLTFAVRYRRRREDEVPVQTEGALKLELTWIVIPLILSMAVFAWSGWLYIQMSRPPADSMEIYVQGRQWMWKAQHPTGQWENNELHVPVGRNVKLTMISQDVIHDYYIPEFRVKQDVMPGRYTQMWFRPTREGVYNLFCAEYCGTQHSGMIGSVTAMSQSDYEAWLAGPTTGQSTAAEGQRVFRERGCISCHQPDGQGRAPTLVGIYGTTEELEGGQSATVDEVYIRESILNPRAKVVAGYEPIMPAYQGILSEDQLLQLIEYIREGAPDPAGTGAGTGVQGGGSGGASGDGVGNGAGGRSGSSSQPTVESESGGGGGGREGSDSQPTVESEDGGGSE